MKEGIEAANEAVTLKSPPLHANATQQNHELPVLQEIE